MPATPCRICDDRGWVCEAHGLPYGAFSEREDACTCGDAVPCGCNDLPVFDTRHGADTQPTVAAPQIKPRQW